MSNALLTEWIAFMKLEDEEFKQASLTREASQEEKVMRAKRGKK